MAADRRSLSNVPAPGPESVRRLLALLAPTEKPQAVA